MSNTPSVYKIQDSHKMYMGATDYKNIVVAIRANNTLINSNLLTFVEQLYDKVYGNTSWNDHLSLLSWISSMLSTEEHVTLQAAESITVRCSAMTQLNRSYDIVGQLSLTELSLYS